MQTNPIFFILLGICTIFGGFQTGLNAQKRIPQFVQQQKFIIAEGGQLKLSYQIEQTYNKFGNIIKQEYLYPRPNSTQLQTDRKIMHSFDARGRELGTMEYNGDNLLETEQKIYWDDKDNKTKIEEIRYTNGERASNITTYSLQYDEHYNKKSETFFSPDGTPEKIRRWYYNKNNELIKSLLEIEKKNQPKKSTVITYKRDKSGNLYKTVSKEMVNGKEYRKDIQFFAANQVIKWRKYIEGKFDSEFVNEYRDSVVIRTTSRNTRKIISIEQAQREQERNARKARRNKKPVKSSEIWVTNSEYDAYGNIVITTQSMNNKVVFVTQYEYDDYGNCIHTTKMNKDTDEKEDEFVEYESQGNIYKRTFYKNGELLSEERFSYEYHE